ncbi:MAG: NAD-dependent epimerase/dehydratase family protein [Actinomycetota bacterium]
MKVLLTGGFGCIGLCTLEKLINNRHKVRIFDIKSKENEKKAKKMAKGAEIFWGSVSNREDVESALKDIDLVIHLAFLMPPNSEKDPNNSWNINIGGTKNLTDAMRRMEKKPKIIFTSSVSVYGRTQHQPPPRNKHDELKPTDNYSHHKVACEQLVKISGLKWSIFRLGAVLSFSLTELNPMLFSVPLDTRIEIVHPQDVAEAFTNAVDNEKVWNKVLLIGGGEDCRLYQKEFVERVMDATGVGMLPQVAFGIRPFYTDWLQTDESQKLLNYQKHNLDDFTSEIKKKLGLKRHFIKIFSPAIRYFLLRRSPYLKKGKPKNNFNKKPGISHI